MPLRQVQNLPDLCCLHIDLHHDAVRPGEDFIPVFIQNIRDLLQIRTLGYRTDHIPVIVKNRQPGTQAILRAPHVSGIHLMVVQLLYDIRTGTRMIHHTHKRRPKLHIRNVLHHVAAHPSMHLHDSADISTRRNVLRKRVSLDVHKTSSEYCNSHGILLLVAAAL